MKKTIAGACALLLGTSGAVAAPNPAVTPHAGQTPASPAWPACRPGPGDDRCIQLHERGVRAAYAQWTGGEARDGMGGPDEDEMAAEHASALVQHPQGEWMPGPSMRREDVRTAEEMRTGSAWAIHGGMSDPDGAGDYQGVGGPDEGEEMGVYPPCRSRSDDRCQQRP